MKNLTILLISISTLFVSGCMQQERADLWSAAYDYRLEDIMGNEINFVADNPEEIVNSSGFSLSKEGNQLTVVQSPGCAKTDFGERQEFRFHNHAIFTFQDDVGSFTESMFETMWESGKTHLLGNNGGSIYTSSYLYIRIKDDGGEFNEYVTNINATDEFSRVEVISKEIFGESEEGYDVYEVKIRFQSRMVNMDDSTDVLYLKEGSATLKVVNFAGER